MRQPTETGVVITMAGLGSRFTQAGYTVPKYEIEVHGRSLFSWSMESLRSFIDSGSPFIFVARKESRAERFIASECQKLGIRSFRLVELSSMTDGQATTALLAQDVWDDISRPLAIYNIDTYVDPTAMPVSAIRGSGWIPCFPGEGDKWSFAEANETGRVTLVREKKRISPHATVGLYWFDSFARYATAYSTYYAEPKHIEGKERYVAPLYNQLIQDEQDVYSHVIPARDVYPLGTPEDVDLFASRPFTDVFHMAIGR